MKARLATVTDAHVVELLGSMRREDRAECVAFGHADAREALEESLEASSSAWAVLHGDDVLAITGVVHEGLPDGTAYLWCLSSEAVEHAPVAYMRISRQVVQGLARRFHRLVAATPESYTRALRWLERLGFDTSLRHVIDGVPFRLSCIGGA